MSADLVICADPDANDKDSVRRVGVAFHDREWAVLFFDVLECPRPSDEQTVDNDDIQSWTERWNEKFRQALPDYPMLRRIIDLYRRIWFKPSEVAQLRDDAAKVCACTSNEVALAGLQKLIFACDEALKMNWWLVLVGD